MIDVTEHAKKIEEARRVVASANMQVAKAQGAMESWCKRAEEYVEKGTPEAMLKGLEALVEEVNGQYIAAEVAVTEKRAALEAELERLSAEVGGVG